MEFHHHALRLLREAPSALTQSIVVRLLRTILIAFSPEAFVFTIDQAVYQSDFSLIAQRANGHLTVETTDIRRTSRSTDFDAGCFRWTTDFSSVKTTAPYVTLEVSRASSFAPAELALLQFVSSDFERLVQSVVTRRFEASLTHHLCKALGRLKVKDPILGTILADLVFGATHSIQADVGIYMSVAQREFHIDYVATRRHRRASVASHRGEFDAILVATLTAQNAHWVPGDTLIPPSLGSKESRKRVELKDHRYLIIPIRNSSSLMGCYAFGFADGRPTPSSEMTHRLAATLQRTDLHLPYRSTLQRSFAAMIVEPIYRGRETRVEQGKCAVLMPFTTDWSGRIWTRVLRPRLIDLGFQPVRADDLFGADVMEDVWQMILSSEVVVAEITGRNPNVFYELGLAHSIGKPVVLLTQNVADIPFDLNRYRHIIYQDNLDGYEALNAGLVGMLNEIVASRPKSP